MLKKAIKLLQDILKNYKPNEFFGKKNKTDYFYLDIEQIERFIAIWQFCLN
jgi:hypothetical protein